MPWYNTYYRRRWNQRRKWRRRRLWRRNRKTFRTRSRRRRYRVRKRKFFKKKLKKLTLKQYQPSSIRRCKIKGLECIIQCNVKKISFNFQMYESSIVPNHLPGGGGMCIKTFSLDALYEAHQHCRNYWTHTNTHYPLCRYLGCKIRCYQSQTMDWVIKFINQFPMVATVDTYSETQPSILMMSKYSKKIPSKITKTRKRPYITVRMRPPAQMQNKWFFMHDISHTPLLMIMASGASFDNYYISTKWDSTNINITTLKTGLFTNTNFKNYETSGYYCTKHENVKIYLYATLDNSNQPKAGTLIPLLNTKYYVRGSSYNEIHPNTQTSWANNWTTEHIKYRGNPFYPDFLQGNYHLFQSVTTYSTIINTKNPNDPIDTLTRVDSFTETLRYSPNRDTGENNITYFKPVTKDDNSWNTPNNSDLINIGYPLWILIWGFPDFQKRLGKLQHLETEHTLVIKTSTTYPIRSPLVPISQSFIEGHSPFESTHNSLDNDRWYPSLQYQYEIINLICQCGPGTPKLNGRNSVEAKIDYTFYFKFGGSPPTMSTVDDPADQPTYPIPNNISEGLKIQSPAMPIQSFLYHFDTKRDIITKKAADRIKKDWPTKPTMFTDGTSAFTTEIHQTQTENEEKETEETLLQLLEQQHQQQQQLKQRILNRMKIQNLE
nr:MAG: ORF1 [TTV-like mini virus]